MIGRQRTEFCINRAYFKNHRRRHKILRGARVNCGCSTHTNFCRTFAIDGMKDNTLSHVCATIRVIKGAAT